MKNQKGVSLISLIITIIVIIILAAIVMQSSTGTVDEANYAGFAQEIGDYTSAVTTTSASIKADAAVEGVIINDAQKNYMLAKDIPAVDLVKSGDNYNKVMKKILPEGQVMTETILRALGYVSGDSVDYWENRVLAYRIEDDRYVDGYTKEEFDFYGDSNGEEEHYVTSDGKVFTLPGYPQTQEDKSIRYYITATDYYTVKGQSSLGVSEATKVEADPLQESDIKATLTVDSDGNETTGTI